MIPKINTFILYLRGLSAGTGKLCIFGHLGLVFIWSCFVSRLLFLLYYVICAPVLTEGTCLCRRLVITSLFASRAISKLFLLFLVVKSEREIPKNSYFQLNFFSWFRINYSRN